MSWTRILPLALAALLAVVGWNWWTSDARQIHRRFAALIDEVEKSPGEGQLMLALKAEQAAGFFAEPFRFRARQFDFDTEDRPTLTRTIAAYRMGSERIGPDVLHEELTLDSVQRTARLEVVVRFAGGLGGRASEGYRFQLDWIEQGSEWKIAFADLIEIVPVSVF